jgi:hypothetical protein
MSRTPTTVKLDNTVYLTLSDLDQFIVDRYIDRKNEYTVESVETDQDETFLILEGVPNIGFDSTWFKTIN